MWGQVRELNFTTKLPDGVPIKQNCPPHYATLTAIKYSLAQISSLGNDPIIRFHQLSLSCINRVYHVWKAM